MTTQRSVLITGGGRGIGFGLAQRFHARGDVLLITGRNPERLAVAARRLPGLRTVRSDISSAEDRQLLAETVRDELPELDLLINNAGVQRRVGLAADTAPWPEQQAELDTVFSGPVHLTELLIPLMLTSRRPATIVNVTSGGALIPQPFAPLYSAAKAALHSYTMTLREALSDTSIGVVELIPPAVATGLSGRIRPHGADVEEFCDVAVAGLDDGRPIIGFGPTDTPPIRQRLRCEQDMFETNLDRFPVVHYRHQPHPGPDPCPA